MKISPAIIVMSLILGFVGVSCTSPTSQPQETNEQANLPLNNSIDQEAVAEEPVEEPGAEESMKPVESEPMEVPSQEEPEPMVETEVELDLSTNTSSQEETEPEIQPTPQIRTFDVVAKQWSFVPEVIRVNEGDTVRMNVSSTDVDHGVAISAFGVNTTVKAGETEQIEFVANKKGTFTINCSVFCGTGHGSMKGTLIVE